MIERTAIVIGPGGVGKTPLDFVFKPDIIKMEPYRLRPAGPRGASDVFYANPKLRDDLRLILARLGDRPHHIDSIEWFAQSRTLFFEVRHEWQFLTLLGLEGAIAKAEIYAPVLTLLLSDTNVSGLMGKMDIILLNPASESVTKMRNWQDLEDKTRHNCTERGDSAVSVQKRVSSIAEEAPAWKKLIGEEGATEYCNWQFPEYLYTRPRQGASMVSHQKSLLMNARECLLRGNPELVVFVRSEEELHRISGPFVR